MKVDDKICVAFNTLRNENQGKKFTRKEIQELLVDNVPGFSKQDYMISMLVSKNIIHRIGKGRDTRYEFPNTPIHIASLSNAIFGMKEYNSVHFKKAYDKKRKSVKVEEKPKLTHVDEEYCIKFLKERGYRIMKKVVNYEEV